MTNIVSFEEALARIGNTRAVSLGNYLTAQWSVWVKDRQKSRSWRPGIRFMVASYIFRLSTWLLRDER